MTPEQAVQQQVRLALQAEGCFVWRNNVGASKLANGSFLRWGLANESKAENLRFKSADLIGIRPVPITPEHVGRTLGVFLSREVKAPGWRYNPNDPHEAAQMRWAELVRSLGGDACFTTGTYTR